jgi:hypothetical protein
LLLCADCGDIQAHTFFEGVDFEAIRAAGEKVSALSFSFVLGCPLPNTSLTDQDVCFLHAQHRFDPCDNFPTDEKPEFSSIKECIEAFDASDPLKQLEMIGL